MELRSTIGVGVVEALYNFPAIIPWGVQRNRNRDICNFEVCWYTAELTGQTVSEAAVVRHVTHLLWYIHMAIINNISGGIYIFPTDPTKINREKLDTIGVNSNSKSDSDSSSHAAKLSIYLMLFLGLIPCHILFFVRHTAAIQRTELRTK